MRVDGPDGQQWTVGRRWLPWRPRAHELEWVSGEAVVVIPVSIAAEWTLLTLLLPVVLPVRWLLSRWVVVAYGRLPDGTQLRCERRSARGGVAALQATVVGEIRSTGAPRSLGEAVVTSPPKPDPALVDGVEIDIAKLAATMREPAPVTFDASVCGLTGMGPDHSGWTAGALVAGNARLAFHPGGDSGTAWPVPPAIAVTMRAATDADGPAVAGQLVVDYRTTDGRTIRIAVTPHLGPVLQSALLTIPALDHG